MSFPSLVGSPKSLKYHLCINHIVQPSENSRAQRNPALENAGVTTPVLFREHINAINFPKPYSMGRSVHGSCDNKYCFFFWCQN